MFDRKDGAHPPSAAEMSGYIRNPMWDAFCAYMEETYRALPAFTFSRCGMEYGWNAKFRKGSRALCTVYPRENYFVVMVVVGRREKARVESSLPSFSMEVQRIYRECAEGNGQKWLMIPLENDGDVYSDVLTLLEIRTQWHPA